MGYFKQAIIGISWMSAFRVSSRFVAFIRIIILARLLNPFEFGLFGIVSITLAFLEILTETGINVFFIQEKDKVKKHINEAWAVSIMRGAILTCFILLTSPLIVYFFHAQEAYPLLFLISIVPLIRGFINPAVVSFQKNLEFHKHFYTQIAVFSLDSAVAVILAFLTHSAISFVFGLIAGAFLEVILSFLVARPIPKINLHSEKIKHIIHRGKWVTAYGIFNYLAQEGDTVVVGKLLGAQSLGIYQMAYKFSTLPISEITDVVNKVVFPVYALIADDKVRLMWAFRRSMIIISLAVIALSLIIFILPQNFFTFILGRQWSNVTEIIKILTVYGMARAILSASSTLLLAVKRQDYIARITLMRLLALTVSIIPLTIQFGLTGTAFAVLFSVLIELPFLGYFTYKTINAKSFAYTH